MKLPCYLVEDLLPNYVDGLTSDDTNKDIEEHLHSCQHCSKIYNKMKEPIPVEDKNIDYLKQVKKNNLKKIIISITAICLIFIFFILCKYYIIGYETGISLNNNQIRIEDNCVKADIELDDQESYADYYLVNANNETCNIVFKGVKKSFINKSSKATISIPLSQINHYLYIGNKVVSNTGEIYDQMTFDLINNRIMYVGNHVGVGNLLGIVSMSDYGDYTIALQTTDEPYSITIHYKNTVQNIESIKIKSQLVLSCIDNCNTIFIDDSNNIYEVEYDKKINDYSELQKLVDKLK